MLIICAKPFDNNWFVFYVLFADETSRKYVSLSGLISLSNSGENGKVGIILTDDPTHRITRWLEHATCNNAKAPMFRAQNRGGKRLDRSICRSAADWRAVQLACLPSVAFVQFLLPPPRNQSLPTAAQAKDHNSSLPWSEHQRVDDEVLKEARKCWKVGFQAGHTVQLFLQEA